MEQWIEGNLVYYKKIFRECREEAAISNCALSMAKILNALSEMKYTQFHRYEKKIFWNAMKIFSKQCIEQIGYTLNCEDVEEKKVIISDIEESISDIMEVFKNIFSGTENVERQVFQSLSVDTSMYELSPKLCAFYSAILEKAVMLFGDKELEYAFVIHPTLRSAIETKILLRQRRKPGKVVIVYIAESVMENFEMVPVCLLHEVFHVITKRERNQKKRAFFVVANMILYMKQFLFQGIDIDADENEKENIKERLMEYWFASFLMSEKMIEYKTAEEDSGIFSKNQFRSEFAMLLKQYLLKIRDGLEEAVMYVMFEGKNQENYHSYLERFEMAVQLKKQIQDNINQIILKDKISAAVDLLLFMYRETYADLACILALELNPQQYKNTFLSSIQFQYDKASYQDNNKDIRELLVTKAVLEFLPIEFRKEWKARLHELVQKKQKEKAEKRKSDEQNKQKFTDRGRQKDDGCVKIVSAKQALDKLEAYLSVCGTDFSERLGHISGLKEFRREIKKVMSGDFSDSLLDILAGRVNPDF